MKLISFNQTNTKKVSRSEPIISVNSKTGMFRFSAAAAELLKLKSDTQVEFAQDEEKRTAWFLTIVEKDGFLLSDKKGLQFNSLKLAGLFIASVKEKIEDGTYKLKIVDASIQHDKKMYWPIDLSLLK